MPSEIAEDMGLMGGEARSREVADAVREVTRQNTGIMDKVISTGNNGPVMSLVGKVMKAVNRRGDPV